MPFFGTFAGLPWNKAPGNKRLSMKRLEFDLRKIKKTGWKFPQGDFCLFDKDWTCLKLECDWILTFGIKQNKYGLKCIVNSTNMTRNWNMKFNNLTYSLAEPQTWA